MFLKKKLFEWIEKIYLHQRFYINNHKQYSMLLGRYQSLPPHKGHCSLVYELLKQDKNVLIVLRKEDGGEKNPFSLKERKREFSAIFKKEIKEGKVKVVELEDVVEVCYGRTPGWKISEIRLDKETESISATKIRGKNNAKNK